jgi:hypothetical protein
MLRLILEVSPLLTAAVHSAFPTENGNEDGETFPLFKFSTAP